jgi:AraC family transcriptional regulator, chitin signaling transcriptional activator
MFQKTLSKYFLFFFVLNCLLSFSQELPPILKYSPSIYGAGNQNWMISQDKQHFVYFANNDGLLQYNGSSWNLYKSPNETIIRSVKVIDNKVYTGCYGIWVLD